MTYQHDLTRRIVAFPQKVGLLLEALWMLLKAHALAKTGYAALRRRMNTAVAPYKDSKAEVSLSPVLAAVRRACHYYPATPACLQRSIALVWMLRKRGIPADLEIGVRQPPFESHAWVEVGGRVINDTQTVREVYQTIHEFKAML